MQYKTAARRKLREIASELGVAHIVEGSVQRAGNRVRVRAQLIDARDDTHLWADRYDRPLDDVFAIQTEISKAVAEQLQASNVPNEASAFANHRGRKVSAPDLWSESKRPPHTPLVYRILEYFLGRGMSKTDQFPS